MIRPAELERGAHAALRVEVVRELRRFTELRDEWDALLSQSDAGPTNAWASLHPWHVHLGPERTLYLLAARDPAGQLAGLLPLCLEPRRVLGLRVWRLSLLGEGRSGSGRLDVIARRGDEKRIARRFAEFLRDRAESWDLLELSELESGSPTLNAFRRVFAQEPFRVRIDLPTAAPDCAQAPAEDGAVDQDTLSLRVLRRQGTGAWLARSERWGRAWRRWMERVRGSDGRGGQ